MAPYCNFKIQLFQYKIYHRRYAPWIRIGSNCCHQKLKNWRPGQIRVIRQRVSGSPTKTKESIQKTVCNLHLLQLDSRRGLTLNLKQFLICIWTLSIFTKLESLKLENKLFLHEKVQIPYPISKSTKISLNLTWGNRIVIVKIQLGWTHRVLFAGIPGS